MYGTGTTTGSMVGLSHTPNYTLPPPSTLQQTTDSKLLQRTDWTPPELVNIVNIHTAHHNSASQLICYSPPEWRKESNK